jgi:outer membrane translocation and assembly module TamA
MAHAGRATRRLDRILADRALQYPRLKRSAFIGLTLFVISSAYLTAAVRPLIQRSDSMSAATKAPSNTGFPSPEKEGTAVAQNPSPPITGTASIAPTHSAEQSRTTGQMKLRAIRIAGGTSFPPEVLKSNLKLVRINSFVTSEMVEYDVEFNLMGFLREHGFLQAEVRWNYVRLAGRNVELYLQVTEGPQYRLKSLSITGAAAFAPENIASQFNLHPGDIVNASEIKEALERIQHMYANQGFILLSYLPEEDRDPSAQTESMTINFDEGIQFHVAYVAFVGCDDQAQEDGLRARVNIRPGETYSVDRVESALAELKKLGVTKNTVETVDDKRGLIGIVFWLQSPRQ